MADAKKLAEQLKKLNELRGPVPQELRDRVAAQNKAQRDILDALKEGPKTAPELAAAAGLEAAIDADKVARSPWLEMRLVTALHTRAHFLTPAETLALPTSPYRFCDSLAELQAAIDGTEGHPGIGYPCIVKPVMSSSGKGQSKIDGPADVKVAWDYAMAGGRVSHGRVIVEGFIDFDYEITLLTVRHRDGATGYIRSAQAWGL